MKKKSIIIYGSFLFLIFLSVAFFIAYKYVGVGGRIIKTEANAKILSFFVQIINEYK